MPSRARSLILCITFSLGAIHCADAQPHHVDASPTQDNNQASAGDNQGASTTPTEAAPMETTPREQDAPATGGGPDDEVPAQSASQVVTTSGEVRGEEDRDLRVFKGIPYAEPPVGERRFSRPVPVSPWDGVKRADDFGASCMQGMVTLNEKSEDCLTLNVWAHQDKRLRPVMVWIYGGGFILGETAMGLYDGSDLARDADVVVISLNYRLGLFGNLALRELAEEDEEGALGNMGLLDQIEALRWIKANARAFGGDPENITVFGESAGAMSTCALMGAPAADDLFQKAIVQSGNCSLYGIPGERALMSDPLEFGEEMTTTLGCEGEDRLACLRALPAKEIADAIDTTELFSLLESDIALGPVIDGVVLKELPSARIIRGAGPERAVIFGSNGNEGQLFASTAPIYTRQDFEDVLEDVFHDADLAEEVVALYPRLKYPLARDAFIAFFGELLFNCDTHNVARAMPGKAYQYHLMSGPALFSTAYGPLHAADIPYVFGNFLSTGIAPTLLDLDSSTKVQTAWGAFAHTGAPVWEGGWPEVSAEDPEHLEIGLFGGVRGDFRDGRCEELQRLGVIR